MSSVSRVGLIQKLQADILRLQGFKTAKNTSPDIGLGFMREAFPNRSFPIGAVHEFLSDQTESIAPASGFIAGLLSSLMRNRGTTLWISSNRTLFPPALKSFNLEPDRFIFIDLKREKDVLWAMEETLKCSPLTAVVSEVRHMDFTASRRLQLAVEESQVTGFIIRHNVQNPNTTACVSRWKITSLQSDPIVADSFSGQKYGVLPGIGFPKWKIELLRMRNGRTGAWDIQWINGRFVPSMETSVHPKFSIDIPEEAERKTG